MFGKKKEKGSIDLVEKIRDYYHTGNEDAFNKDGKEQPGLLKRRGCEPAGY